MTDLQYPIGTYKSVDASSREMRTELISQLAQIPGNLRLAVRNLSPAQLDTPYREGGWTVRQVVHHLADANLNWYIRTKLALTEDVPAIATFDQALWSELPDARLGPVEPSLALIDGLNERWVSVFTSMPEAAWERAMSHPERGKITLMSTLPLQVWHGQHHTAQITELRKRMGWA
jgi:uncharacterized damage-inducible protein DinB